MGELAWFFRVPLQARFPIIPASTVTCGLDGASGGGQNRRPRRETSSVVPVPEGTDNSLELTRADVVDIEFMVWVLKRTAWCLGSLLIGNQWSAGTLCSGFSFSSICSRPIWRRRASSSMISRRRGGHFRRRSMDDVAIVSGFPDASPGTGSPAVTFVLSREGGNYA